MSKVWIIGLMLTAKAFSQVTNNSLKSRIDSMVLDKMQRTKVVGVAIGIVKNDKIYYSQGYGTQELNTNRPIDSLTNFHLASISKVLVATAIMQLVEEGKINLDAKLLEYIPVSRLKDERFKDITIKQMLIHTSGIPDEWNYHWSNPRIDSLALGSYAKKCIETKKLLFQPGTKWRYSNIAFEILGHVIERVTKKSFEAYEFDNVLSKAGLKHSNFDYTKIDSSRRSSPHIKILTKVKVTKIYPYNREHGPSSTLNSCTYDMCQWILELIRIYDDKNDSHNGVVSHKTLMDMWSIKHSGASIGLNWCLDTTPMGLLAWHDGGDRGYGSLLLINPEQKFGMIMLVNGEYSADRFFSGLPAKISMLFKDK